MFGIGCIQGESQKTANNGNTEIHEILGQSEIKEYKSYYQAYVAG